MQEGDDMLVHINMVKALADQLHSIEVNIMDEDVYMEYLMSLSPSLPKSYLANFSHSTWHVLFLQCACFSFRQLHFIVGNNYMNISLNSMLLQVFIEFI